MLEVDEVVVSVGVSPNPLIPQSVVGLWSYQMGNDSGE